jgi:PhnB protein
MSNQTIVKPYLFFDGKCEEALEFYRRTLDARVTMLMRFKDSPEPPKPGCAAPGSENKVMHAEFSVGQTVILASDGRCGGNPVFQGFGLAISMATATEVDRAFNSLAEGGQLQAPLEETFFSARFGMVIDRYGVFWMVMVTPDSAKK